MQERQRLPRPLIDAYEWQDRGLCRKLPVNMFFDLEDSRGRRRDASEAAAKRVCGRCPVVTQCLSHAMACEDSGVWGGLTARERQALRVVATAS